ncbi:MAG TPA: ABC transporter permease [Cerasibacillus sp.]|uniref:ABC transporter permease n=1 Tax=Cerasibacillus sp. TaxID=2498711 RepID=UPI002F429F81
MIRFIWKSWWRRKERLILLLIGALMISVGLTYLVGISDSNKGTIEESLQKSWTASYDIVVRPQGSRSMTEEKGLLEPNYLSGLDGGISVDQYEKIKNIRDVEIAAPIAMIGYASYTVNFDPITLGIDGIYRQTIKEIVNNGVRDVTSTWDTYFAYGDWPVVEENLAEKGSEYGVGAKPNHLSVTTQALLAGIDPEQESKLVGLEKSIVPIGNSRYFNEVEFGKNVDDSYNKGYLDFPVIVSNHAFDDKQIQFTIERLDIPFEQDTANDTLENIKNKGGIDYLHTFEGIDSQTFSYSSGEAFTLFINSMTGIDIDTGEPVETDVVADEVSWMVFRPSPLDYQPVSSPFQDQWPFAYQVNVYQTNPDDRPAFVGKESFREPKTFGKNSADWPQIRPNWIGFYDPSQLDISRDPANELPMETYRPATAELVIDAENRPVNPSVTLKPTDNPYDFLTNPPSMLTTIEAAEQILGDLPISAIRVKVAGVTEMNEESQAILERVAREIENETGLMTDITLGSSPQLTLTHVPTINDEEAIGWLQQPWVNIGSSISIFRETKIGYSGVILSVMVVAVIYVWASTLVSLLTRRKEFAVLLSIGWRPGQISRMLIIESFVLGCFVSVISWLMLGYVYMSTDTVISPSRFLLTGLFGFLIYLLGAIVPVIASWRIKSYETLRTGEFSRINKRFFKAKGIFFIAFNHFIGKWKRSLLSVLAIALPTGLLALFLYITFRLQGVMYTTWLGKYTALEVGAIHYTAMIVALLIAILTTAEMMWQNIAERAEEMALFKAIGWRNTSLRFLIWSEGILSGVFAAIIGLSFAFIMIWSLYGAFPTEDIIVMMSTGLIPIIIGVIGTIIPAERAVRMQPNQGMRGQYVNKKSTEKGLKIILIGASVLLISSIIYMMIQVTPQLANVTRSKEVNQQDSHTPTKGDLEEVTTDNNEPEKQDEEEQEEINSGIKNKYDGVLEPEENLHWSVADFQAKEVERRSLDQSEESIVKVSIEFTYRNTDSRKHQMELQNNFTLRNSYDAYADIYQPSEITVLNNENWDEEGGWLEPEGEVTAVMEFEVPKQEDPYLFHFKSYEYPKGLIVIFK